MREVIKYSYHDLNTHNSIRYKKRRVFQLKIK